MENKFFLPLKELSPHLGGDIEDIDVREIGTSVPLEPIKDALFRHQLLCFRDQNLEPWDLSNFTSLFGDPLPHVLQQFSLSGHPEIYVLSNIVKNGRPIGNTREGFGWHTDLAYMARPAAYTILYGIEVPNMFEEFDKMEEE